MVSRSLVRFALSLLVLKSAWCTSDFHSSDGEATETDEHSSYLSVLAPLIASICAVILIACADLCPRRKNFQDFENADVFN